MTTQQGLLTAEEFAALPHEGLRLELIEGELHAMAPSYADHGDVVGALHAELGVYIRRNHLGKIYGAEEQDSLLRVIPTPFARPISPSSSRAA